LGLPRGTLITAQELQDRVNECTGINLPAEQRSPEQRRNLTNITRVLHIPETFLAGQLMMLATYNVREFVQGYLTGRNPFPNVGVKYAGSDDDEALNNGVLRYRSDPQTDAQI